jgi:hypothetical protein
MMNGGFDSPFAMPGIPAAPPPMQYAAPSNRGMPARAPGTPSLLAQQQQQPQQIVPPRPIIRAQRGDDPPAAPRQTAVRPTPLSIPSPEELGVARATDNVAVDWTTVHNQLNRMGASCFHLEKLANGGCRITCLLPGGQQGRSRHIEAEAASEAEAIRATLAKADEWASRR